MFRQLLITTFSLLLINHTQAQTTKTAVQYYNEGIKLQDNKKYTEAINDLKAMDSKYAKDLQNAIAKM